MDVSLAVATARRPDGIITATVMNPMVASPPTMSNDWTLTVLRTDIGREIFDGCVRDGVVEVRPGDDDPGAIALMHKLALKSRKRWPEWASPEPIMVPPPKPKPSA